MSDSYDDILDSLFQYGGDVSQGWKDFSGHAASALGFGPGDHSDEKKADALIEQLIEQAKGLTPPDLKNVALQGPEYAGDVTPERVGYNPAELATQGNTHLNDIAVDPRLKEAQLKALASLQGVADSGGMTAGDTANMRRMQSQVAGDDAGRRNAILQGMQQRGLGGSGMELLAQLQGSQASTDREAQQGLDVQGMAQQRALQAMMQGGQLGGDIRGQDFAEQARIKGAQDAIDQFNTQWTNQGRTHASDMQYQSGVQNAGYGLQAGLANRGARQDVNNATANTANQQTVMNNMQIPQQRFQNQVATTQAKQAGYGGGVDYYGRKYGAKSAEQGNKAGSVIGGATTLLAALSHGGEVPGRCAFGGDNSHNDKVPAMLSPGEVVVPRSIAHDPTAAMDFLKHPPNALSPDKKKEAMLSALRNLHKKQRGY